jgi:hypothetical protein
MFSCSSGIENKVQICLVDIMIQLVDEVKDIPREVAESIFEELKQKVSWRMYQPGNLWGY